MEERLKTPSVVPVTLRASADAPGVSALRTRRLAAPDRTTHHASSVTIRRDACAPFRSGAGFTQHLCGACGRLRASPLRPSQLTRFGGEPPSPASAVSTACSRLGRPSTACLAACREARPRCVPTDFCFPLLRLRAPAPRRLPASLRSLRFALDRGLAPLAKRPEDLAFHDARSASAGRSGSRAACFCRPLPDAPCL